MNKLFGLFLFALACWAPDVAQAAARFAICTVTCTWDNTSTAMWSTSSNGATGASAPTASDSVTIDAATCQGGVTCTITTFSGTISVQNIAWGACTASTTGCIIDADTNDTNFTISLNSGLAAFSGTGTGTRKWLAGSGAYAITQNGLGNCLDMATTTNDQGSVFSAATWSCAGTVATARTWAGGGFSFGPTTVNANTSRGAFTITGTNTFASLTIAAPNVVQFPISVTTTITGALTVSGGSSSAISFLQSTSTGGTVATLSLGSASTASWLSIKAITTSGAAGLTATSCFDLGLNTFANGGSCAVPSGGGGGGRIIGG